MKAFVAIAPDAMPGLIGRATFWVLVVIVILYLIFKKKK
ncbi:hypothetical protein Cflav_PD3104 [Pedosphaera parvula Ellin514]|uniref:Uncharacterized protein n=1 Tax=Pedosphaera parvula (strain Ellin514) TaxID=320771 RepID=B9XJI4_PEDPL|nr:hypothetical protein Cflav_PD3104 [Pedosphaera parvula Ellin514]